ncbi:hypothetical protein vseg_017318 [Gypsophila vaccaria]
MLTKTDWSVTPEILDPYATTGFNSLEIKGQLVDFYKLVQDLSKSRLLVNRRGYCYFQLNEEGITETTEEYGITFYRMNDLWKWCDYGVKVDLLSDKTLTNWDRLYILDGSKPPLVSDNQVVVIKYRLEETKIQLREKNYEVIRLKSEVYKKDGENKSLKDRVATLDSEICEKNAQNEALVEQVRRLESELEDARRSPTPSALSLNNPPVPSSVFVLKSIPFRWPNYNTYSLYWTCTQGVPRILTPSTNPVNSTFPIPVTFNLVPGYRFDVNNWFYMRVWERTAPILIYEGNAHTISVCGSTMTSPIGASTIINWGEYVDVQQEHFDFVPVSIVGYGSRIAILQW